MKQITLRPHQQQACDRMLGYNKGQIIVPTGGGKTLTMIVDTQRRHDVINNGTTTVVVAPRILLAEQLCSEFMEVIDPNNSDPYLHVLHVHSGETHYTSTTNAEKINVYANCARNMGENCIIFTTYHSLHRIVEADIEVNTIYFDEAHNSVQRNFFPATEHFSEVSERCYFYTATPKHSLTVNKPGMNWGDVYGQVICNVPAPDLVDQGYILPPKVVVKQLPLIKGRKVMYAEDSDNLIETIDDNNIDKTLICARSTKQIMGLVSQSDFVMQLQSRGYSWMMITSKTGAIIDGQKVDREKFFDTLNTWGKDPEKKFVVIHHSILSEGINVSGLEAVIFMRNMDYIGISQSIGRVIRLGSTEKTFGLVCIPTYDSVGISTARKVQAVVDVVFNQGQPAISEIRR
jgi:superfamily II DNA or RNA helicase|tara:strand:- start:776 stop:1984 length:1209 start_codon:yes stop_codon:yes gene_type:complete